MGLKDHHHAHKKDAPSGTAKKLIALFGEEGLDLDVKRAGDTCGLHALTLTTPEESLSVIHEVTNRAVYAKGALWAARELVSGQLESGFLHFEDLVRRRL